MKILQESHSAFADSGIPGVRGLAAMQNQSSFLSDLPSCPSTFSAAHLVTLNVSPLWLRVSAAVKMSSLPRYEIDRLIKEKLVKVAWRENKAGTFHPLLYAPSLWSYMDSLPQTGPAEEDVAP